MAERHNSILHETTAYLYNDIGADDERGIHVVRNQARRMSAEDQEAWVRSVERGEIKLVQVSEPMTVERVPCSACMRAHEVGGRHVDCDGWALPHEEPAAPKAQPEHGIYAGHLSNAGGYIEPVSWRVPPLPDDVPSRRDVPSVEKAPSRRWGPDPGWSPRWWAWAVWAGSLPFRAIGAYAHFNAWAWDKVAYSWRESSTPQPDVNPAESTDPNVRYAGEAGLRRFLADLDAGTIYPRPPTTKG